MTQMPPLEREGAWTTREVRQLLALVFEGRRRGGEPGEWYPNTAAVASQVGVTRRSVERWVAGSPEAAARMPARRLEQLLQEHRPTEVDLRREAFMRAEWETNAVRRRLGRGRGNLAEFADRGWLEGHRVAIAQEIASPLRRVLVTKVGSKHQRTQERGVTLIAHLDLVDRIDAERVRYEILRLIAPWRLRVGPERLSRGGTQIWLEAAPLLGLTGVHKLVQLRDEASTL